MTCKVSTIPSCQCYIMSDLHNRLINKLNNKQSINYIVFSFWSDTLGDFTVFFVSCLFNFFIYLIFLISILCFFRGFLLFCFQDTVIYERLGEDQQFDEITLKHMEDFARDGKSDLDFLCMEYLKAIVGK